MSVSAALRAALGDFYGQSATGEPLPDAIGVDALVRIIDGLLPGITELGCHPGLHGDGGVYADERGEEVRALCDPRVRAAVDARRIRLCSFHGVAPA